MSFNRENVIWKSKDGTWNRGFFACYQTGEDPEWDVEYEDRFDWVATGLPSEDAAWNAWDGANPGGSDIYSEPGPATDQFDQMAPNMKKERTR